MTETILQQLQRATDDQERTWLMTAYLLQSLPPDIREAAEAAAVPHWFDAAILAAVLQVDLTVAEDLYCRLQTLPFTDTFGNLGYTLHDLTRASIVRYLFIEQRERLIEYARCAAVYFQQTPDDQHAVEALYHQFIMDPSVALRTFKKQMSDYRNTNRFSAANNLLRNARELDALGCLLPEDAVEVERQEYLMGWKYAQLVRDEKAPAKAREHFTQALRVFGGAIDAPDYPKLPPDALRDTVATLERRFLEQKLTLAQTGGDILRERLWRRELADTFIDAKDYASALSHLEAALLLNPEDAQALASRGLIYHLMADYSAAVADYTRAIELDDQLAWVYGDRGLTYQQQGNYPAALADLNRAIELDDKYAWAYAQRGETYRLMADYSAALADYTRAIELDDQVTWVYGNRGLTYQQQGSNYSAALADYTRAIELDDQVAWVYGNRGLTYQQQGNYPAALADYTRAIELDDKYAWAYASRGLTYHLMADYSAAVADYTRAIELDDQVAWFYSSRGLTYREQGNYPAALADYTRAIELDDKYTWVYASRGLTYHLMAEYSAALADYTRAIELDDQVAWAYARRGETYRLMKDYPAALADFTRTLEFDDKYAWAYASRGETYRLMADYPAALADFTRALELDDQVAWVYGGRGQTYRQQGNYPAALADFAHAFELDPEEDWCYYERGLVYLLQNLPESASEDLVRAIELARAKYQTNPQDWRNALNLALYHLIAGEIPQAETLYLEALTAPAPPVFLMDGVKDLEDLLRHFPDHPQARAMRDRLQHHLDEEAEFGEPVP